MKLIRQMETLGLIILVPSLNEDYTLFFYKNIFYKNIKAEIRKILRIF